MRLLWARLRLAAPQSRTPILATGFVLTVWLGWSVLQSVHLILGVSDDVLASLRESGQASITVTLAVSPERFHAQFLREVAPGGGRVKGQTYYLYDVPAEAVYTIGRQLWVTSVTRWDGN